MPAIRFSFERVWTIDFRSNWFLLHILMAIVPFAKLKPQQMSRSMPFSCPLHSVCNKRKLLLQMANFVARQHFAKFLSKVNSATNKQRQKVKWIFMAVITCWLFLPLKSVLRIREWEIPPFQSCVTTNVSISDQQITFEIGDLISAGREQQCCIEVNWFH